MLQVLIRIKPIARILAPELLLGGLQYANMFLVQDVVEVCHFMEPVDPPITADDVQKLKQLTNQEYPHLTEECFVKLEQLADKQTLGKFRLNNFVFEDPKRDALLLVGHLAATAFGYTLVKSVANADYDKSSWIATAQVALLLVANLMILIMVACVEPGRARRWPWATQGYALKQIAENMQLNRLEYLEKKYSEFCPRCLGFMTPDLIHCEELDCCIMENHGFNPILRRSINKMNFRYYYVYFAAMWNFMALTIAYDIVWCRLSEMESSNMLLQSIEVHLKAIKSVFHSANDFAFLLVLVAFEIMIFLIGQ